jgi:hypothetical protein
MNPTSEISHAKNYKAKEIHQDVARVLHTGCLWVIFSNPPSFFTLLLKLNIVGNKMVLKILFKNRIFS